MQAAKSINNLLDFAKSRIEQDYLAKTKFQLKATADLRKSGAKQSQEILDEVIRILFDFVALQKYFMFSFYFPVDNII